jgi:hypothetical protein
MTLLAVRPSLVAAAGLVGGFAAARYTGRREVGGLVFAAAGSLGAWSWYNLAGPGAAAAMTAVYATAMGVSHPLAKKLGAWPSVLAVTAATAVASELVDRRGSRP